MTEKKRAVALGLFDGVHLGHRTVVAKAAAMAEKGFIPSVFTFDSGSMPVKQGRSIGYIYTDGYKEKLLRGLGINDVISEDFPELKDLSGEEFVKNVLAERLGTGYIVCGRDFRFGRNASYGVKELAALSERYGIVTETADDVVCEGEKVSSRRIRQLLSEGDVSGAEELLGGSYVIADKVREGNRIGRTISFPTINQHFREGQLVPRAGVYATFTTVGGRTYDSITDIGVKPTVGGESSPLAETHILGFNGDIYGFDAEVGFRRFIRPEMRFGSLDELKKQIESDVNELR